MMCCVVFLSERQSVVVFAVHVGYVTTKTDKKITVRPSLPFPSCRPSNTSFLAFYSKLADTQHFKPICHAILTP